MMTKWIIGLVAIVVIGAFAWFQHTSTKTAYINGLPEYNTLPGREYIFERDCYIFKFKYHASTYPLVGANAPDLPLSVPSLPADVKAENVGQDFPEVRILDLVHTGDRFKIVSVRRDTSPQGSRITFEILFMDEADRKYPRLDAYYIMDHRPELTGTAPHIIEGYAVQRVKK